MLQPTSQVQPGKVQPPADRLHGAHLSMGGGAEISVRGRSGAAAAVASRRGDPSMPALPLVAGLMPARSVFLL